MESTLQLPLWSQVAEIEIVYKTKMKSANRPKVIDSKSIYNILMEVWDISLMDLQDLFKVLLLNRNNRVLSVYHVSKCRLIQ